MDENDRFTPGLVSTPPGSEYGPEYYDTYGHVASRVYTRENPHWLTFFGTIADEIIKRLHPRRVLDLGCAKGFLVECLRDRGVEAYGSDISEYAISEIRPDIKPYCSVASASSPIQGDFDLITCIEVCEHMPEADANEAIQQMTSHSDTILFSSTPSDFTEPTHVNVHPIIDWLRLFAQFSFAPDVGFDTRFIAPQAILLRRSAVRPVDKDLCRFAQTINRAVAISEIENSPELCTIYHSYNMVINSKGWRLLNVYRDLRARVKRSPTKLVSWFEPVVRPHLSYARWIRQRERQLYDPRRIAQSIAGFRYMPTISIIMPAYKTPIEFLDSAIQSVLAQHYAKWELCICDDGSQTPELKARLVNWQERDPRIKVTYSPTNGGISVASNHALSLASGEFIGLVDHDDELSPDALFEVVNLLQEHRDADIIYSDEDKLDPKGRRTRPHFKPDWSPEQFLAGMYFCHFGVYRKQIVDEVGGFRAGFEGAQDYDLALRVIEKTQRIYHIPKILYHWRMAPTSFAVSPDTKQYAHEAGRRALNEHMKRRHIAGEVVNGTWPACYRVRFNLDGTEKISIIVLNLTGLDALTTCIKSIEERTSYRNYEIVIIENGRLAPSPKDSLLLRRHKIVSVDHSFNSSELVNFGIAQTSAKYVLLLHDATEVISSEWLDSMLGFSRFQEIGAVGAKLLYRTGRLRHIGIVVGIKGLFGYPLKGLAGYKRGYLDPSETIRNCSAISGACMMFRREVFERQGGFDKRLSKNYNDVDFCLRLQEAGYRVVWTPDAQLYYDEPISDPYTNGTEVNYFKERWHNVLQNDPYYNPNLTLTYEDLGYRL